MKKNVVKLLLASIAVFMLSGCTERLGVVPDLDTMQLYRYFDADITNIATVDEIDKAANLNTSELSEHTKPISKNIIVTSTVNVNDLRQTSNFGRLYSESMMTNFIRLGWNVIDFRGQDLVAEVKNGEFYLDRSKLSNVPSDSVVYVGTYGEYKNGLLINVRLLNYKTNEVITASNVQLNDADALALSRKSNCTDYKCTKDVIIKVVEKPFIIGVEQDDCKNTVRCECVNPDNCLEEECTSSCSKK